MNRTPLVATAVIALLVVAQGGTAAAAEFTNESGNQVKSIPAPPIESVAEIADNFSDLTPLAEGTVSVDQSSLVQAFPTTGAFAGCYGQTDDPHQSFPFASVHARTRCAYASKATSTNLSRLRWWGWQQLANGGSTGNADSVAKWYCAGVGDSTYQATTFHRAVIAGKVGTAYTANS